MGFSYRLYPSYHGYNGVGGEDIDKILDQAQGLAQPVPTGMQCHLGGLSVREQVPAGTTEVEISVLSLRRL